MADLTPVDAWEANLMAQPYASTNTTAPKEAPAAPMQGAVTPQDAWEANLMAQPLPTKEVANPDNMGAFKRDALSPLGMWGGMMAAAGGQEMTAANPAFAYQNPEYAAQITSPQTQIQNFNQGMGLDPTAQYTNEGARMAGKVAGSLTGSLPFLPVAAMTGGGVLPYAASVLGGTMTGEGLRYGAETMGAPHAVQTGLDIAGNLAGGYGASALASKYLNPASAAMKEFADAGVRPLPSVVDSSPNTSILPGVDQGFNWQKLIPFYRGAAKNANEAASGSWQEEMEKAAQLGADSSQVGGMVQKQGGKWVAAQQKFFEDQYDGVKGTLDAAIASQPTNTINAITLPPAATGAKLPSVFSDVQDAVLAGNGSLNYPSLDYWKQTVGKFIGSDAYDSLVGSDKALVGKLYNGLKMDAYAMADSQIPGSGKSLASIDSAYNDYINFQPKILRTLADNNVTGGQVWDKITSGSDPDASIVGALASKGVIGKDAQEAIASQTVRQMGVDASTGLWNPKRFFAQYQGLSDQAKSNLFGFNPDMQSQLERLGNIAQQINVAKMPTKSALRFITGLLPFGGAEGVTEYLTGEGIGHLAMEHPVGAAVTGVMGAVSLAASRLMTSTPFINFLSKPVTGMDKFIAGLNSIARYHPELTGDLNMVGDAVQSNAKPQP